MKRALIGILLGIAIAIATLCVLEGSASAFLFLRDYRSASGSKTLIRPYTTHDTLLGWVDRPSFTSPDEYGKGIGLTTTSRAVRGNGSSESDSATKRAGLVCSGDSYTLGVGVSDDHTWCALLGKTLGDLTYNMGQVDYGLDQSILRYQRDGALVPHQTQILGITNTALERMTTANIGGRLKPTLAVEGGTLVRRNVPVPETTMQTLRAANRNRLKHELRIVHAYDVNMEVDGHTRDAERIDGEWTLVEHALDDLARAHKARGTRLLVVYLPMKRDLKPSYTDERRKKLAAFAQQRGIEFLDLTLPMRTMRADSLDLAFISRIPRGAAPGVGNQYSDLGHVWVATKIAAQFKPGSPRELPRH